MPRESIEIALKPNLRRLAVIATVMGALAVVPAEGALDADAISRILVERLAPYVPAPKLEARLGVLGFLRESMEEPLGVSRLFHFCSGCPHSRSTTVPEGSLASAGIGCHGMAMTMDRSTSGITHMGGEGVQWVGMAPFTDTPHLFQNLGDGTLFHSGTLAIRQAVASGANITFKILHNGAVAMKYMQALVASGDRAAAIAHATEHAERLAVDLQAEPDPDVALFAAQLRENPDPRSVPRGGITPFADVTRPALGTMDSAASRAIAAPNPENRRRRRRPLIVVALCIVGLIVIVLPLRSRTVPDSNRVVVAPFDNLTYADDGTLYISSFVAPTVTEVKPDGTVRVIPVGTPVPSGG